MKKLYNWILVLLLLILPASALFSQIDLDAVDAEHDFQWGIISYHRGEFNQAILSLEKSLAVKPDWAKTKLWLGNAYYRAGFTDAALNYWSELLEDGEGSLDLKVKVDNIRYRRSMGPELKEETRFVQFHEISGETEEYSIFKRPCSVFPLDDGGFYISSFATNEIQRFSANGVRKASLRGGFNGLNHPFDMVPAGRYVFISEYSSDRIVRMTPEGNGVLRFGGSGSGEGKLIGPQFIADDGVNHIYVSESGNARVSKFDYEGNFILSFGVRNGYFGGLREPTGVAYSDGRVLVADSRKKELYLFDRNGNYLASYKSDLLVSPEGVSVYSDHEFLIADRNRVLLFDIDSEVFRVFAEIDRDSRLLKAVMDRNGNIVAADFNGNRVTLLSDLTRMYTGLDVEVERIISDNFPEIIVEVSVQTAGGTPYVGLEENNFLLTEESYSNRSMSLISSGNNSDFVSFSYVVEGSPAMKNGLEARKDGMADLLGAMGGIGSVSVVSAETNPVLEAPDGTDYARIADTLGREGTYSSDWSFDLGIRMAAGELLDGGNRRAVVFLSAGKLGDNAFTKYTLSETIDYLLNNHISFYTVYFNQEEVSPELEYISRETGGMVLPLYGASGIGSVIDDIRGKPSGFYSLRFRTSRDSDFGRNMLPLEIQVSHFDRSGKASSVYYGPGQ